jgi:large subunit ribosomal protein L5
VSNPLLSKKKKITRKMATTSLLSSSAASFYGRFPTLPPHLNARVTYGSRNGVVSVRATGDVVLVDKSEAEKSNRLKTTFLEKIVPLLIEEFSYTNIHQVTLYKFSNLLIKLF